MAPSRHTHFGHQIRFAATRAWLIGEPHARCFKIPDLADRRRQQLSPAIVVDAGGRAQAQLVRIGDPIRTDIALGAEELTKVEIGQGGVEDRQGLLVAERRPKIKHAGLERDPSRSRIDGRSLETQSDIDPG